MRRVDTYNEFSRFVLCSAVLPIKSKELPLEYSIYC